MRRTVPHSIGTRRPPKFWWGLPTVRWKERWGSVTCSSEVCSLSQHDSHPRKTSSIKMRAKWRKKRVRRLKRKRRKMRARSK
ncbi:hypothetical protein H9Q69_001375 [Fusarium xylarioides]|uniref:60S ribosomal protein L41 n=1 Tax=Fusarium xylarioides TaxID=221167 RepID=A0A9P7I5L6_9HYPO|nr:hypothetical protein H9Q70_001702 [Fusarium xylarioides]KAG5770836.1 hypothetical protein H9Q72_002399 [Fusarium xylarioides]KAG5799638.1 hypothetical protein H9Q69_001375 [Fusarium xylarioides]